MYARTRIAGTPIHFYKAELRYEHPCGFYGGPNVEWNIGRYPADEANTLFADSYALFGFRIGYKSRRGLEVFFEVKNLTDKIYAAGSSRWAMFEPTVPVRSTPATDDRSTAVFHAFGSRRKKTVRLEKLKSFNCE